MKVHDKRHDNEPPTYYNHQVNFEFKQRAIIGAPGAGYYSGLMTLAPWSDNSGGENHQLNFNRGGIFYRTGLPDNANWNNWVKVLTTDQNNNLDLDGNLNLDGTIRGSAEGGALKVQSEHGYIDVGARDGSWAHIYTDRSKFIFNKSVYTIGALSSYEQGDLELQTNGSTHLRIENGTGRVGIGSSNDTPISNSMLDITGPYATGKFASQLHLHTENEPQGLFLGSYGGVDGAVSIMSSGGLYNVSGYHKAFHKESSAIHMHEGRIKFFSDADLSIGQDFRPTTRMTILPSGNIGIGTIMPDEKLTVHGNIRATGKINTTEVKVSADAGNWPDYVFEENFKLQDLSELETYIKKNKHLPGIPTAQEVEDNDGIELGEMNRLMLEKIEELSLHTIRQEKLIIELIQKVEKLENK